MRRKVQARPDPVIPEAILEQARRSISEDSLKKMVKCTVCGADTELSMTGSEALCWVCRRLKVSAWREIEPQLPAQE